MGPLWSAMWPNIFAPSFWTLIGLTASHLMHRSSLKGMHEEREAMAQARHEHLVELLGGRGPAAPAEAPGAGPPLAEDPFAETPAEATARRLRAVEIHLQDLEDRLRPGDVSRETLEGTPHA